MEALLIMSQEPDMVPSQMAQPVLFVHQNQVLLPQLVYGEVKSKSCAILHAR